MGVHGCLGTDCLSNAITPGCSHLLFASAASQE